MAGRIRFYNGEIITWERLRQAPPDPQVQALLLQAHRQHRYPVCMCRVPPPPLYVRRSPTGLLHLSRMPGTMHQHAPDCVLYQEAVRYAPPPVPRPAAQTLYQAPGQTKPPPPAPWRPARHPRGPGLNNAPASPSLALPGLLQTLWHCAGLDRLTPAEAGTRSWPLLYPRLLAAARNILVLAGTMEDLLFLPQPYAESRKAAIDQENARRFGYFQARGQHMLVVGQLRRTQSTEAVPALHAHKLFLHHLNTPLRLPPTVFEVFSHQLARFSSLLEESTETDRDGQRVVVRQTLNQRDRLIVMLAVEVVRWKSVYLLKVQESYLMRTHASYIPVHSAYESMLVSELVRSGRAFLKPLQFDAGEAADVADFVLLDGPQEVPMEIYGYRRLPAYDQMRRARIERYRASGTPYWAWDVAQNRHQWPPLPKPA